MVLNPSTPVGALEEIAGDVDFVLVMSVNPGFGGQTFIPRSESKVREVRALLDRGRQQHAPVEIDGGIDLHNVGRVVAAGARIDRRRLGDLPHARSRARDARAQGGGARAPLPAAGRSSMSRDAPPSISRVRVRYAETDKMGVVYYANYLVWFEVGRTDLLRQSGWSYREMEVDGFSLPVIEAHCAYQRSRRSTTTSSRSGRRGAHGVAGAGAVQLRSRARRRRAPRSPPASPCTPRSIAAASPAGCRSACATLFS